MSVIDRRTFVRRSGAAAGALAASGPLGAFTARALAQEAGKSYGYGPLVPKVDARGNQLYLPEAFDFVTVQQQGDPMRGGVPTPGIFDGMGAFRIPGRQGTVLVRNHENREQAGEAKVATGSLEYDPAAFGGCTRLVVDPRAIVAKTPPYVLDAFAVLGGTSTNCAGGQTPWGSWITCEEVVKRTATGRKHGYVFEIDASADGPVAAVPAPRLGRFAHEAIAVAGDAFYLTEDQSIATFASGPLGPEVVGSAFYRFVPDRKVKRVGELAGAGGVLQALAIKGEPKANMDAGRVAGESFDVEWVDVPEPDHDDDTNARRDRVPGFTPTRVQALDAGAAIFDREEGAWVGNGDRVYFDCTSGGPVNGGQIWEYDPHRERLTLVYQSSDLATLDSPDNVVIVPRTGDILVQEDGGGDQFVRGITRDGSIYDFARSGDDSDSEFCGGCFDPSGEILYVNQQGGRGSLPGGPAGGQAITYAIFGPFERRAGDNGRHGFGR